MDPPMFLCCVWNYTLIFFVTRCSYAAPPTTSPAVTAPTPCGWRPPSSRRSPTGSPCPTTARAPTSGSWATATPGGSPPAPSRRVPSTSRGRTSRLGQCLGWDSYRIKEAWRLTVKSSLWLWNELQWRIKAGGGIYSSTTPAWMCCRFYTTYSHVLTMAICVFKSSWYTYYWKFFLAFINNPLPQK